MDKVEAIEAIEVLKAYCDGKEIEVADKGIGNWGKCSSDEPYFNFASFNYRIKPTEKYRPYKDCDEMIEDFKQRNHFEGFVYYVPMIWVKDENATSLITDFGVEGDNERVCLGAENYDMEELFNDFKYLDGSPVGAKE